MAKTSLGKVGILPKGEYSSATQYLRLDIVSYNGSSYLCIKDCVGIDVTNKEYWLLIAQKGDKGDIGEKGDKGDAGKDFSIYKTYASISAMESDASNVPEGEFVLIASNVEDEDNAKLYVKGEDSFVYLTDLSGATGIKGEKGEKGDKPVNGVDYNTPEEKEEFKNEVVSTATTEVKQNIETIKEEAIQEFNSNASTKTNEYNDNTTTKLSEYNTNANSKVEEYNSNATQKTNTFNENATTQTETFNNNAISKTNDFNSNASTKTEEFNAVVDAEKEQFAGQTEAINHHIAVVSNELERVKNEVLETREESGSYITLNDSAMAEYQELSVDGVCEQEITTGSQEFNFDSYKKALNSTYGNVVSGTYNSFTIIRANADDMSIKLNLKDNTKYYIKFNWSCSKGNQAISIEYSDGTIRTLTSDYSSSAKNGIVNFTTDETKTLTKLHFVIFSTDTNYIINNMIITTNSTATIEPYTGGQPSPSLDYPQEIKTIENSLNITSCNKNLAPMNIVSMTKGGITLTNNNNGSLTLNGTATSPIEFVLATNFKLYAGTYTHSINKIFKGIYVSFDNIGYTMLNGAEGKAKTTFELSKGKTYNKYFILIDKDTIFNNDTFYIQLERGAIKTSFEEHIQSQITANLPEGEFIGKINDTYKDTLKVEYNEEDGEFHLILNKMLGKIVLDLNTISIECNHNDETFQFKFNKYLENTSPGSITKCSHSKHWNYNFSDNGCFISYEGFPYLLVKENDFGFNSNMTIEEAINHLKQLLIEITYYYTLFSPYEVDLGVIDMPLTYNEITNLFTDSDLMPIINAKYYRNFTKTIADLQDEIQSKDTLIQNLTTRVEALEKAQVNSVGGN